MTGRTTKAGDEPLPAGQRLKRAIHVARARTSITSDTQLALRAGVHYDTLMNWYSDRTTPRPAEVKKVADAMGASFVDLMAAYEGRDPEPRPLVEAIRELVDVLREARAADRAEHAELVRILTAAAEEAREADQDGDRR